MRRRNFIAALASMTGAWPLAARALNIEVPPAVLSIADEVIE